MCSHQTSFASAATKRPRSILRWQRTAISILPLTPLKNARMPVLLYPVMARKSIQRQPASLRTSLLQTTSRWMPHSQPTPPNAPSHYIPPKASSSLTITLIITISIPNFLRISSLSILTRRA